MGRMPEGGIPVASVYASPKLRALSPKHYSMARMFANGMSPKQIALNTGFTQSHISRICGTPMFQLEVERIQGGLEESQRDIRAELEGLKPKALGVLDEELSRIPDGVRERKLRVSVAVDVLDRGKGTAKGSIGGSVTINQTKIDVTNMGHKELQNAVLGQLEDDQDD